LLGLVAAIGLSACGSTGASAPMKPSEILTFDAITMTVHLELDASATSAFSGFNFDGYGGGAMTVRVPVGWTVNVTCRNDSTVLTHSCAIVDGGPLTVTGGAVAFQGASIPNATSGLVFGASAGFTFVTSKVGTYRIDCLVTAHELDGMWDWFVVTQGGRPDVVVSK
jgi:hypothetical protein